MGGPGRPVIGPALPPGWRPRGSSSPCEQWGESSGRQADGNGTSSSSTTTEIKLKAQEDIGEQPSLKGPPLPAVQLGWGHAQGVGCGLNNLGNSCYLNSVLQCLAYLPPLGQLCLTRQHASSCPRSRGGDINCATCIVETRLARCLRGEPTKPESPMRMLNNLHLLSTGLKRYHQEDAHEALRLVVDAMHRDSLRAFRGWTYKPPPGQKEPESAISALFGGELQSQVKCLSCGRESNTVDPFMDLSLEITGCDSLLHALGRFTEVERLDGSNAYRCDGCQRLVAAEKRISIHRTPHCLVIHLKRFVGFSSGKIGRSLTFREDINLAPYVSGGAEAGAQLSYKLCGVVVHTGASAHSGHYYAYVRDGMGLIGTWHCMDDGVVTQVGRDVVFREPAYLLMYCRKEYGQNGSARSLKAHLAASCAAAADPAVTSNGKGMAGGEPADDRPSTSTGTPKANGNVKRAARTDGDDMEQRPAKRKSPSGGVGSRAGGDGLAALRLSELLRSSGAMAPIAFEHLDIPRLSAQRGRHFGSREMYVQTRENIKCNLARLVRSSPLWQKLRAALGGDGEPESGAWLKALLSLVKRSPESVVGKDNWRLLGLQMEHCLRLMMDADSN